VSIPERDHLRKGFQELQAMIDSLEATKGRMEMLAHRINPMADSGSEALGDLERLAGLKARGMLTEDQFEVAKKALLSRWLT